MPLGLPSRLASSSIVRTFGAPVTDAEGCSAAKISSSGRSRSRFDQGSHLPDIRIPLDGEQFRDTSTVPTSATRPRSLRIMSTTITFSARSFAEAASDAPRARSPSSVRPRRAVPFMGLARMSIP